jgi:hypothetical protein
LTTHIKKKKKVLTGIADINQDNIQQRSQERTNSRRTNKHEK